MVNISRNTSQVCGMMGNKADATHQAASRYIQLARQAVSRYVQMDRTSESRCYASGWTQEKGANTSSRPTYIRKKHILYPTH
jgi:hypothetical protein